MKNFNKRLKQTLTDRGITQVALAEHLDISPQSIQKWMGSAMPSNENLVKIAEFLNVSPAWLLFGSSDAIEGYFVEVPETKVQLSAGCGAMNYEVDESGSQASYRSDWFNKEGLNPKRCIRLRVKGDSMQPFLWDNDVVLINLDETDVKDGSVYAFRMDDDLYVKRLAKIPGVGLRVTSENPYYGSSIIESEKLEGRVSIIGRVRDKSGRGGL